MQIEIPKTIRRLKQKFIEELYSKYEGEDVWKNLRHYKDKCYEEKFVNTIGIWMSGGADSSMLAYLLAKKIKDMKSKNFQSRKNPGGTSNYPAFKKGGSVKKKKSSGAAIRGKGCEIR